MGYVSPIIGLYCNLKPFKYLIHLAHKPDTLGLRHICHARAPHPVFCAHQQFNHHTIGFKIDSKIEGLALRMFVLEF